jgi:hypothetical protein
LLAIIANELANTKATAAIRSVLFIDVFIEFTLYKRFDDKNQQVGLDHDNRKKLDPTN